LTDTENILTDTANNHPWVDRHRKHPIDRHKKHPIDKHKKHPIINKYRITSQIVLIVYIILEKVNRQEAKVSNWRHTINNNQGTELG
jgi:hypothetical protein